MFKAFRERRHWAAFIVNFVLSPILGMLYLGRAKWSLFYFFLSVAALFLLIGFDRESLGNLVEDFWGAEISSFDYFSSAISLVGAIHGALLASRLQQIPRTWYARWWGVAMFYIIFLLVPALAFRSFAYQPFNIPSGSMLPTLEVGDYLFANKYVYGINRYSVPLVFQPLISEQKRFGTDPQRGDVVIFKLPADNRTDYIKRVIGLPGDRVQMKEGRVILNGSPLPQTRTDDYPWFDFTRDDTTVRQFVETLPNGVSYRVLDVLKDSLSDNTDIFVVPEGHYFLMGDNRDNASDSRFNSVGYIPKNNIHAKASWIWYNSRDKKSKSVYLHASD